MHLFELWFSPGICPVVGFLGHMVVLFLAFWGTSVIFSIMALPIYIPTNSVGGLPFLYILSIIYCFVHFLMMAILAQLVKNLPANARYIGSVPGSGSSPVEGNGNLLQYSFLENSRYRGAWWATVHGVTKSQNDWATELKWKELVHEEGITFMNLYAWYKSLNVKQMWTYIMGEIDSNTLVVQDFYING